MNRDDLIERAAGVLRVHHIADGPADRAQAADACACGPLVEDWDEHWAEALADAGLLADPEQHAELRRLQRVVERLPYRQRDYDRARLELRKLNDAMARKNRIIAKRSAERDALQARLDAAHALTEPHPTRHWDTQWPIRAALEGVSAAEYAGEAGTDVTPPLTSAQRAELDELARRMLADDLANLDEPTGEADRG